MNIGYYICASDSIAVLNDTKYIMLLCPAIKFILTENGLTINEYNIGDMKKIFATISRRGLITLMDFMNEINNIAKITDDEIEKVSGGKKHINLFKTHGF